MALGRLGRRVALGRLGRRVALGRLGRRMALGRLGSRVARGAWGGECRGLLGEQTVGCGVELGRSCLEGALLV